MKTQNKKGFTIVELVIVIAVIAILAAVLIPTFINLTKKANESNLTVMVTNLNKSLRTYEALNGEQKTMHGAVLAAQDAGYDLVKLASEQSEPWIVYDPENREFVKEADVKDGEKAKYFRIYKEMPATQTFSIYLSGEGKLEAIETNVGFDAGMNVTSAVNYKGNDTANVTIRMNGGKLTVNNPQATVNYYGEAQTVTVEAVAENDCFHVFGKISGDLTAKAGKVTFEATANVSTFLVEGEIQIAYVSGAQIGTATTSNSSYLSIIEGSQLPAECKSTTALTEAQKTQNELFAGGLGTEKSPYLIATAEQWKSFTNPEYSYKKLYWSVVSDLDLSGLDKAYVEKFNGSIDFNGHTLHGFKPEQLSYGLFLFKHVVGATIQNLDVYDVALIYEVNCDEKTRYNDAKTLLKNINARGSLSVDDNNTTPFVFDVDCGKIEFNNCDTYMTVTNTGNACAGLYVGTVWIYVDEVKFVDCDNYGTLIHSAGYSSMLVSNGGSGVMAKNTKNGTIINEKGFNDKGKALENILIVSNCHNYGTIVGVTRVALVNGHADYEGMSYSGLTNNGTCIKTVPTVIKEYNGKLDLKSVGGAARYQITYTFWQYSKKSNGDNCHWGSEGYTFNTTDISSITLNTYKFINGADIPANTSTTSASVGDGTLSVATIKNTNYYVFNPDKGTCADGNVNMINAQPFVSVFAYDADGRIVGVAVYTYSDTKMPSVQ